MSDNGNCHVILFKSISESEDEDDIYSSTLRSAGFQVTLIPVLEFEFVNLDEFSNKLLNPNDYEGIIFSSPRCVAAMKLSLSKDNSVLKEWEKHKHFAVGDKTAKMVESLGLVALGRESGNAKNLADIICKAKYSKPFLYPKGSLTKDNFKLLLKEKQVEVDDVLVYKTKPHSQLEILIQNIKQCICGKAVFFVYFSPSGVNFTLPIFQKHQFDLNHVKFVAIGPTTEAALKENELQVAATSLKPDPSSVLDAINKEKGTKAS